MDGLLPSTLYARTGHAFHCGGEPAATGHIPRMRNSRAFADCAIFAIIDEWMGRSYEAGMASEI
jgi:hypothetical protein